MYASQKRGYEGNELKATQKPEINGESKSQKGVLGVCKVNTRWMLVRKGI